MACDEICLRTLRRCFVIKAPRLCDVLIEEATVDDHWPLVNGHSCPCVCAVTTDKMWNKNTLHSNARVQSCLLLPNRFTVSVLLFLCLFFQIMQSSGSRIDKLEGTIFSRIEDRIEDARAGRNQPSRIQNGWYTQAGFPGSVTDSLVKQIFQGPSWNGYVQTSFPGSKMDGIAQTSLSEFKTDGLAQTSLPRSRRMGLHKPVYRYPRRMGLRKLAYQDLRWMRPCKSVFKDQSTIHDGWACTIQSSRIQDGCVCTNQSLRIKDW